MTFPLALLLIPYGLAVIVFLVFASLHVYHLIHYGAATKIGFTATFIFFAGTVLIAGLSLWMLGGYDWSAPISFTPIEFSNSELPTL
ncbi:hypothetical protein ACFL26_02315 [Patescibacteria group bacterium]